MAHNGANFGSKKPLHWREPDIKEAEVRKSTHAEKTRVFHQMETPPTSWGTKNGVPSAWQPNPYHPELNPPLILKAKRPEWGDPQYADDDSGRQLELDQTAWDAGAAPGQGESAQPQAETGPGPKPDYESVSDYDMDRWYDQAGDTKTVDVKGWGDVMLTNVQERDGKMSGFINGGPSFAVETKPGQWRQHTSPEQKAKEWEGRGGQEAGGQALQTGPRGGKYIETAGGSKQYVKSETAQATDLLKAIGAPNVPLRPQNQPQMPGMPPQPGQPPMGQGQPGGQQMPQPGQPPMGAGAGGKPPGVQQPGQMQPQPMGTPSIPGAGQAGMQQQMMPMAQQPIGYTPDMQPIYPDPFHPAHQGFGPQHHAQAAGQQQMMGNPQAAQVHEMEADDSQSPMERAAEKFGPQSQPMGTQPMGGRTPMPGQAPPSFDQGMPGAPMPQGPGPASKPPDMGAMDSVMPKAPDDKGTQAPAGEKPGEMSGKPASPSPGPERDGPKPGMEEKPKDENGPEEGGMPGKLAKPEPKMPPTDGPNGMGGPMQGAGEEMNMMDALQQWLMQQMKPGMSGPSPAPGGSSQQDANGGADGEDKSAGSKAPPTHAGFQQAKVNESPQR